MIFFAHYSTLTTKTGWFNSIIQSEPCKVSVYCLEKPELFLTQYVHLKGNPLTTVQKDLLAKELKVSNKQVSNALRTFGVPTLVGQQKVRELLIHKTTINQKCDNCSSHITSEREAGQVIHCSVCAKPIQTNHIIFGVGTDYWGLGTTDLTACVKFLLLNTPKKIIWNSLAALELKPNKQTNINLLAQAVLSVFDLTDPKSYSFLYKLILQINDARLRNH